MLIKQLLSLGEEFFKDQFEISNLLSFGFSNNLVWKKVRSFFELAH